MLATLTNPIFWQGFACAWLLALIAIVVLLTLLGAPREHQPIQHDRRAGERRAWPGRRTDDVATSAPRTARSELRGGPR